LLLLFLLLLFLLLLFFLVLLFFLLLFLVLLLLFFCRLFLQFFSGILLGLFLGQFQVVQGVFIIGAYCQRLLVGLYGTLIILELVAGIAKVVECIGLDLLALNIAEGFAGIRIAPCTVKCNTAFVVIGKCLCGSVVVTFPEKVCRILFGVSEQGCTGAC